MNKSIFSMNSLSKYSDLFQIVGVIGLIASLIFVGMELRQSHKIALSAQQQQRVTHFIDIINTQTMLVEPHFITDQKYLESMDRGGIILHNSMHQFWHIFEADFLRYRLGLLDEGVWESRLKAVQMNYSNPLFCSTSKYIWESRKSLLNSEFVNLVESTSLNNCGENIKIE